MGNPSTRIDVIPALKKDELQKFIEESEIMELAAIRHKLFIAAKSIHKNIDASFINNLKEEFPFLPTILHWNIIEQRLPRIDDFFIPKIGIVQLDAFMPEFYEIIIQIDQRIDFLDSPIEKANTRLWAHAESAGADASVEAAIYCASRGTKVPHADSLKAKWHKAICNQILSGVGLASKTSEDVKKRAKSNLIPLPEAAAILEFNGYLPGFINPGDLENSIIVASFLRALEWFELEGFEAWMNSEINECSKELIGDVDPVKAAWSFFFLLRSNLFISNLAPIALQNILYGLTKGTVQAKAPWNRYFLDNTSSKRSSYLPIATTIAFGWERIGYKESDVSVKTGAIDFIVSSQLADGSWPEWTHIMEGSVATTCMAIHALAQTKPQDWESKIALARNWLLTKQETNGYWRAGEDSSTLMLTVLVLDSIALAEHKSSLTFGITKRQNASKDNETQDTVYNYSGMEWNNPPIQESKSVPFNDVKKAVEIKLGIPVATETELIQVLHKLRPPLGEEKIWKVTHGIEIYYVGYFGQYLSAVTLCTMGAEGPAGSTLTVARLIDSWDPVAIVMPGIAFGADKKKQGVADVLIASQIIPYELQKVEEEIIYRDAIPPTSAALLNRFRNALGWKFLRPDGSEIEKRTGPILTGSKVINEQSLKTKLLTKFPSAIGGEMEGAGVYAAAVAKNKPWIVVKGICDWADGQKHDGYQQMAAASAVSLCEFVFSDPNALNGIQ